MNIISSPVFIWAFKGCNIFLPMSALKCKHITLHSILWDLVNLNSVGTLDFTFSFILQELSSLFTKIGDSNEIFGLNGRLFWSIFEIDLSK